MEFNYNVTGERRKALVTTISEVLGMKAVYKGMPTAAYAIDNLTVTKEGTLIADERTDEATLNKVLAALADAGFTTETPDAADAEEPTGLVISMPMDGFSEASLDNLRKLVDSKATLIRKALVVEALPIEVTDDRVSFPWFREMPEPEDTQAYMALITALCEMAKNQKRVTATDKAPANEKYAFRCFLLRLGFIGDEYKAARKILLRNLTGNTAFRKVLIIDAKYYKDKGTYKQRFVGYKFHHMMKVEFPSDNDRLGKVLYTLANCPVEPEFRLSYTVSDPEAAKNELLGKAVTDAKEKASVLTQAAGVALKAIQSIDYSWGEIDFECHPMSGMLMADKCLAAPIAAEGGSYDMDIEPDDIEVSDTVTVLWEIA